MVQETVLKNGIRIVTQNIPMVKTVSVGVFIAAGSRQEVLENNGVAHFLEHMAFKGTETRSVDDLAEMIENVGGYMNAYTSYDTTAYMCRMMGVDLPIAIDFLSDIICNPLFDLAEMEKERGAILQEIKMYKDSPDDVVFENLRALQYPNHALGRPILGPEENVKNMTAQDLKNFVNQFYVGQNMVISAAGDVSHETFVREVTERFGKISSGNAISNSTPRAHSGEVVRAKNDLEQVYLNIAWESVSILDDDHYVYTLLGMMLGQGMTSKLWREVREKRGLAYSVYAGNYASMDYGTFVVSANVALEKLEEVKCIIYQTILSEPLTEKDLARAKKMLLSSLAMSLESTESQMEYLANHTLVYGKVLPVEDMLSHADAVTLLDIERVRNLIFNDEKKAISLLGPFKTEGVS